VTIVMCEILMLQIYNHMWHFFTGIFPKLWKKNMEVS